MTNPAPNFEQLERIEQLEQKDSVHISLKAEDIFHIGTFPVTNALLLAVVVLALLTSGAYLLRRRLALVPGKIQNIAEFFLETLLNLMDTMFSAGGGPASGGSHNQKSEKYLPLVATIFLFVLFSNWIGLLPGIGSVVIGVHATPLLRAPSADLNFTLALAIVTVLSVNIFGIATIGFFRHFSKFLNFRNPIAFFIGIIELISEIAKLVSFSFRLFGNIFAGEVLLTIVAFLVPYVVPLPFLFLEVFVGFVQALIFSMLAIVFIALAVKGHGEEAHA